MSTSKLNPESFEQESKGREFASAVLIGACFVVFFFAFILPLIIDSTI